MENGLYIETNLVCVCILLILVYVTWRGVVRETEQLVFSNICFHSMLIFIIDVLWRICDGQRFPLAHTVNELLCAAYFIQASVLGYYWLRYSYFLDPERSMGHGVKRFSFAIPMILLIVLNIASIWTGWVFYVDDNNMYHRGPLIYLQLALATSYLLITFVGAWLNLFSKHKYAQKSKLVAISVLGILPFIGGVAQLPLAGVPVFCVCVTFGLLIVFMENQHQLISIDPLTHLNNRNQLNYFLDAKLNSRNSEKHLVLFVMDLDYFKQINDKYGHMEGDRSLVILSNVLKRVLGPRGFFIARIGGDEFVTVAELDYMAKAEKVMALLHSALETESEKLPYKISLSIGYAECLPVGDTIPDLFGRADKELYKIKAQREDKR